MSAKKKTTTRKTTTGKTTAAAKKPAPSKAKAPAKATTKAPAKTQAVAKKAVAKLPAARRADFGSPVDGAFAKAPAALAPIVATLRGLIEATVPKAEASIKWGQPFYMIGPTMVCGVGIHKAHVNLIFSGPPGTFVDPKGLLAGDGKTGRHLKLTATDDVPAKEIRLWLKAAAAT